MNLHEYQGKKILAEHGVNIQRGYVLSDKKNTLKIADQLVKETGTGWFVVKAQIHAGGRGKGGGVKLAKNLNELENVVSDILGMYLVTPQTSKEGKLVNQVLITEDVYYPGDSEPEEFYVSILLNRKTGKNMIMYSTEGGMDIESVAEKTPELIFYEDIDPLIGIVPFQARKISFNLGLSGKAFKEMVKFITLLYKSYVSSDSSLFEINPVLKTSDDKIMAVDAKVTLDDNSLFRHKEYESWRDLKEENPIEIEARNIGLNYVDLDGNVGCMVNGAGLAMATMDLIKQSGGEPANFLDVGGTADAKRVEAAFRLIMKDEKVEAILVNIFGGIVRCDRVAQGIVDACNNMGDSINIPIIVRLQGTNAEIAKTIIDNCDFKVYSAVEFQEAADKIQELLK
jgi:succinyl-CoA synthetase beta subunit|tara:strand:- start:26284 stop:27477 length:1194 start_codon:yes stop_codon:yes gene_type:complete